MNADDLVNELNSKVKLRLALSPIHGIGVFAIRDITRGEKLYADHVPVVYRLSMANFRKLFPEIQALLLERWPLIQNGSAFVYPDARMLAYMNHSPEPNYEPVSDYALTDIKAREEILEDYTQIEGWRPAFPWLSAIIPP